MTNEAITRTATMAKSNCRVRSRRCSPRVILIALCRAMSPARISPPARAVQPPVGVALGGLDYTFRPTPALSEQLRRRLDVSQQRARCHGVTGLSDPPPGCACLRGGRRLAHDVRPQNGKRGLANAAGFLPRAALGLCPPRA